MKLKGILGKAYDMSEKGFRIEIPSYDSPNCNLTRGPVHTI